MRTVGIVAAVALSLTAAQAHAQSAKAWTAARAGLPADAKLVIGIDVMAVQQTQLFATLFAELRQKEDVGKLIDTFQASCKVDPLTVIKGLVIAASEDQSDGAVYVSVSGIDRTKLGACLKAGSPPDKGTLEVKQVGNITELTSDKETTFLGWVGNDVVVVPINATHKPSLIKWMGGKGALAKSALGKALAKVNTAAPLWGISEGDKELQPGISARRVYGTVAYSKGSLDADVHAVLASAGDATTVADLASKQIAEASQASGGYPPQMVALLKSIKVTAVKDEIVVKAKISEQDLLGMIAMAMSGAGAATAPPPVNPGGTVK